MEKTINEQESLQLISEMITQAKNNIRKGDAFSYLLIGYALVATSLLNAILSNVLTPSYLANWSWLIMVPVIFVSFYKNYKEGKKAIIRTHIDTIVSGIWKGFMWAMMIVFILLFGFSNAINNWSYMVLITPLILCLTGFAQYMTAIAFRFRPFLWGAVVFWVGAIVCLLYFFYVQDTFWQYIIFAVCMIGGFIIPGHMLNRKAEQDV